MDAAHITRRSLLSAGAAALWPAGAKAQANWPTKFVARATAAELGRLLGQSVFVDNKPGGAGNVAMAEVARADDQHTVILGHIGTLAVNPYIFDKLPYDPIKTFRPISLLSKVPSLYVVRPELPVQDTLEVLAVWQVSRGSQPAL